MDAVPQMLAEAKRRAGDFPNVSFVEADITSLPEGLGSFDLTACVRTFHHVARPELVVAELVRSTLPGGYILVVDQLAPVDPLVALELNRFERARDPRTRALADVDLRHLFESNGLVLLRAEFEREERDLLLPRPGGLRGHRASGRSRWHPGRAYTRRDRLVPHAQAGSLSVDRGAHPRRRKKAERLGDAAGGRPKPLVEVGGRPLIACTRSSSSPPRASRRVIVSCSAGIEDLFERELVGIWAPRSSPRPSRSGSAGAADCAMRPRLREEDGPVFALNGDELVDVDFARCSRAIASAARRRRSPSFRPQSPFGVVDVGRGGRRHRLPRGATLPDGSAAASTCSTTRRSTACRNEATTNDDVPRARRRGPTPSFPARGLVAHREHAQAAPPRRRVHAR